MHKRKPESEKSYQDALKNGRKANLETRAALPGKDFKHWKVVENEFPYDGIAKRHHMLVPKRKVAIDLQLTPDELDEMFLIKRILGKEYDAYTENPMHGRSVKEHYHVHLIQWNN